MILSITSSIMLHCNYLWFKEPSIALQLMMHERTIDYAILRLLMCQRIIDCIETNEAPKNHWSHYAINIGVIKRCLFHHKSQLIMCQININCTILELLTCQRTFDDVASIDVVQERSTTLLILIWTIERIINELLIL